MFCENCQEQPSASEHRQVTFAKLLGFSTPFDGASKPAAHFISCLSSSILAAPLLADKSQMVRSSSNPSLVRIQVVKSEQVRSALG